MKVSTTSATGHTRKSAGRWSARPIIRATVLAIGVSLDKPEDDPERRIAVISDDGREIGTVPVYSRPSYENPAP